MVTSFLFCLLLLFAGPWCVVRFLSLPVATALPFSLVIHWAISATFSGVLKSLPFNGWKVALVYSLSSICTYFAVKKLTFRRIESLPRKTVLILFGLSVFLISDLLAIYFVSGWSFEQAISLWKGTHYFRPPFLHDIERDVVVLNAILRHASSPYLPSAPFAYQLMWYEWAALPVSLFSGPTNYPFVGGAILATAFVLVFLLLWGFALLKPSIFFRFSIALPLLAIFFTHTDLYNGLRALIISGKWGIETDLPAGFPIFFRFSSIKSVILVAPQHAFALVFILTLWILKRGRVLKLSPLKDWAELGLGAVTFAASPILWGMSVPKLKTAVLQMILGSGLFILICGFSPASLFLRPNGPGLFLPLEAHYWIPYFPFLWIGSLGVPFLVWIISFLHRKLRVEWLYVLLGLPFFCYILSQSEIRRYYSILCCVLLPLLTIPYLPPRRRWLGRWGKVALNGLALGSLFLHSNFIQTYLFRPSTVDMSIPWSDYFAMNEVLSRDFKSLPVMAAADNQLGIEKPLAMQVTTSFAAPVEIAIHTQLSSEAFHHLRSIHESGDPLSHAFALGYRAILWGPIEDRVWGSEMKRRYLKAENLLATRGSVSLYALKGSEAP